MASDKQAKGAQYTKIFSDWVGSIKSSEGITGFAPYLRGNSINKAEIYRSTGIPQQSFKDNKTLRRIFNDLVKEILAQKSIRPVAPPEIAQPKNQNTPTLSEIQTLKLQVRNLESINSTLKIENIDLKNRLKTFAPLIEAFSQIKSGRSPHA